MTGVVGKVYRVARDQLFLCIDIGASGGRAVGIGDDAHLMGPTATAKASPVLPQKDIR